MERRPNIILALFDALGAGEQATALADASALVQLARQSRVFSNAYTPSPQGGPARASLFTGLDPCVHGVWTDGVALPEIEQTFVQRLAQSGYHTWLCGRRQLAGLAHWTTEPLRPYEYTHSAWAHGPLHRSRQNAYLHWLKTVAADTYAGIFPTQPDPDDAAIPPDQYRQMAEVDDALSFNHWVGGALCRMVSEHTADQPFFGVAGFVVGSALGAEPPLQGESVNRRALQQADNALHNIRRCLAESGHEQNTVIIACAARGNALALSNQLLCEAAIRVPMCIYRPGSHAEVCDAEVSTIDVAPTILELAQLPLPARMQGQSLLHRSNHRGWALSRVRDNTIGLHSALCSENWKLVVVHGSTPSDQPADYQLFHRTNDPDEQHNLASDPAHAATLEQMIDQLIDARCALEDRTEPRIAKF